MSRKLLKQFLNWIKLENQLYCRNYKAVTFQNAEFVLLMIKSISNHILSCNNFMTVLYLLNIIWLHQIFITKCATNNKISRRIDPYLLLWS